MSSKTLTLRWYCPGNGTKSITRPPCAERKRQLEKAGRGGDTNMLAYNCADCQGPKKMEIPENISVDSKRPAGHEKSTTSGDGKARAPSYPPAPPKTGDTPDARHGRQARGVVPACSIPPNPTQKGGRAAAHEPPQDRAKGGQPSLKTGVTSAHQNHSPQASGPACVSTDTQGGAAQNRSKGAGKARPAPPKTRCLPGPGAAGAAPGNPKAKPGADPAPIPGGPGPEKEKLRRQGEPGRSTRPADVPTGPGVHGSGEQRSEGGANPPRSHTPSPQPPRGADPESIPGEASRGVSILEEPMADTPKCKHHPERPAVIRKDGQSMGVCRECLSGQASKAREKRKALAAARKAEAKLKPPPEPAFSPVLRESAPGPVETALSELLSQKAAELARALGGQQRAEITAAGWQVLALLEALQLTDRLPVPFTEPLKYPPEIKSASEFRDQGTWT